MRRWLLLSVLAAALVSAGCDAIYGLDPSSLAPDASNASVEGPDGTIASASDAGADGGVTHGATGMDSTIGPVGTPDGSDEDSAAGDDGPGVAQGGCTTATCRGTCTPEGRCLIILATGSPTGIALKGPNVYFTDGTLGAGAVLSILMDGGPVQTVASAQDSPVAVAVDGTNVYWANDTTLMKISLDGGMITTLASGQNPTQIAVDSIRIYWTDFFHDKVLSAPLSGSGPVKTLAGDPVAAFAEYLVTDGTNVYFTTSQQNTEACTVVAVPVDGGAAVTLAQGLWSTNGIAENGARIYWANGGNLNPPGSVMSALLDGGDSITIADAEAEPIGIATDGTNVYWTNDPGGGQGTVMKAAVGGGPVTMLASKENAPSAIAVDSTSVYWITLNDVRKLTPK